LYRCHLGIAELIEVVEGVGGKSERAKGRGHAGIINPVCSHNSSWMR
jgi:hypothetical protein